MPNYRNRALLDLANGAPCMNCDKQDGTIVAAHSNALMHGRGKSMKAHDSYIAFLCYECHQDYDEHRFNQDNFQWALSKTYHYLWQNNLIKVA